MKTKTHLTPAQIVRIYKRTDKNSAQKIIADRLDKYIRGEGKLLHKAYQQAAEEVIAERNATKITVQLTPSATPSDPYERLERAQRMMNEAIVEIAEVEAKERAEIKIADLKKHYEEKLQQYQAVIAAAQNSSVVGLLRKKFGNN